MVKTVQDSESDNMARNRLVEIKGKRTWQAVAKELGFNQGYLNRVARGKRPASNRLRLALGLHPMHVTVEPLSCGHPPGGKRCAICQPNTPRRYDGGVVRWNRVERPLMHALGALYDKDAALGIINMVRERNLRYMYYNESSRDLDAVTA